MKKTAPIIAYRFIHRLIKRAFIDEIWLFGSRARGDHTQRSDIDLAIVCPRASQQAWQQILDIIDESDTLLKIDCVRFDHLAEDDKLRANIINFRKLLYRREDQYMDVVLWKDYFENLGHALSRLKDVLTHAELDKIEYMQDAAIQRFEFVIELYWKVLKKVLAYEKIESSTPRDVLRKAFQFQLINDEATWLAMLDDRNNTSHVYKQEDAKKVFDHIKAYYPIMESTYQRLQARIL
jgi:nucleotidyltransferase substrate binding protein (TIGR01987 family)